MAPPWTNATSSLPRVAPGPRYATAPALAAPTFSAGSTANAPPARSPRKRTSGAIPDGRPPTWRLPPEASIQIVRNLDGRELHVCRHAKRLAGRGEGGGYGAAEPRRRSHLPCRRQPLFRTTG